MSRSLRNLSVLSALGCSAAMLLSACGADNISVVRDGYLDFDAKRSIGEAFSMCAYTKEGSWHERTLNGIDVPAVVYTATVPNELVVSWVIPEASDDKKQAVVKQLNKSGFTLQTEFAFNVFKNKSFDLTYAQLKFNGQVIAADKPNQDSLIQKVFKNEDITSMQVHSKAADAFHYAMAKALFNDDVLENVRFANVVGPNSRTFSSTLTLKEQQVQNAFAPLVLSEITKLSGDDKELKLTLKMTSNVFNINDMALNEYGKTLYEDNFGIFGGTKLKGSDEITTLISEYDYMPLLKRDMTLTNAPSSNDKSSLVALSDLELGDLIFTDEHENEVRVDLSGDQASLIVSPDVSGQRPLLEYLDKQQELIGYTSVAYPIIVGASYISQLTGIDSQESKAKNLIELRNKLMKEDGSQAPEALKQSSQIQTYS